MIKKLTLDEIARRDLRPNVSPAENYMNAIEFAICGLSKDPVATDWLLGELTMAHDNLNATVDDENLHGGQVDYQDLPHVDLPTPDEILPGIVGVALEELHDKYPDLTAEELERAFLSGFEKAGIVKIADALATAQA